MKVPTGAHSGTGSWLLQRATAVVLAVALPMLAFRVLAAPPLDFAAWHALFAPPGMRVGVLLAGVALALHAWVGVRDVLMDYVRPTLLRLAVGLAVIVVLASSVAWLAFVLWSVA
jgi:succinate dehydrogenase / fumarate reductase membrane anchor subunit